MTTTELGKRKRLGRGLGSLISSAPVTVELPPTSLARPSAPSTPLPSTGGSSADGASSDTSASQEERREPGHQVHHLQVDAIRPNLRQPRQHFDEAAMAQLAASIRASGVMQPILVRRRATGEFELIAGERRLRAARQVPLATIPAIICDISEREAGEWALIENLQREDLNPIERAEAFRSLTTDYALTHQDLAARLGVDRSTITNLLRLNELDPPTRDLVRDGRLSLGHAKVLLAVTNNDRRCDLAAQCVASEWSVRELERRVGAATATPSQVVASVVGGEVNLPLGGRDSNRHLMILEEQLGQHLGTRVRIRPGRKKGTGSVSIEFYSLDEFDGLMERLGFTEPM